VSSKPVLVCDIGGTKIQLAILDANGHVLARERYLVGGERQPEVLVAKLAARLRALLASLDLNMAGVAGLGCSMAGMIDLAAGLVRSAPPLGWQDFPLQEALERTLGCPVAIEMDAYAMTLGEARWGAARGRNHVVGITVGTGVGAGLILDGRAYHGCAGLAGEVGHIIVQPGGPVCNCGSRGCLEALASGPAIAERARGVLTQGRPSLMAELARDNAGQLTSREVFAAARRGDLPALDVVSDAATYLGLACASLITLLNPEAIVLGGGVIAGGADLVLPIIERVVDANRGYWTRAVAVDIVPGALGEAAPLLGAAMPFLSSSAADADGFVDCGTVALAGRGHCPACEADSG